MLQEQMIINSLVQPCFRLYRVLHHHADESFLLGQERYGLSYSYVVNDSSFFLSVIQVFNPLDI